MLGPANVRGAVLCAVVAVPDATDPIFKFALPIPAQIAGLAC